MIEDQRISSAIAVLEQHADKFRILRHMSLLPPLAQQPAEPTKNLLILDTETSGLQAGSDYLIEIGLSLHPLGTKSGMLYAPILSTTQLQDLPKGVLLSEKITEVTGITAADITGKAFDRGQIQKAFQMADFVMSHNAAFDRGFIEHGCSFLGDLLFKPWVCSLRDIPWRAFCPLPSSALPILCANAPGQPFFYEAHRADVDCEALAHLLNQVSQASSTPVLLEVLNQAQTRLVDIYAVDAPYEAKDLLSARGFRWNDGTSHPGIKAWSKQIDRHSVAGANDIIFLYERVYGSRPTSKVVGRMCSMGDRFSVLPEVLARDVIKAVPLQALYAEATGLIRDEEQKTNEKVLQESQAEAPLSQADSTTTSYKF